MRIVDTDSLVSDSTNLKESITDLNTEVSNLNTSLSSNQNIFQGKRGTKFFETLTDSYMTDLQNLVSDIENYQEFLSKVPKAYEMLDEEYASKSIDV